ncbi:MAG TPA: hypothetical protein VN817_10875 [Solirubrobacteraceae bacterium]|nr:hypothetical protein [Solirubrobacteraceae bacterium]
MRLALSQSRDLGDPPGRPQGGPQVGPHPLRLAPALLAVLFAFACLATGASVAVADTGTRIIERCTHGQSLSGFSQKDYRRALAELPTEVEEYSDCANLIRHAQLAAAGGGGGGGFTGGGSSPLTTPISPAEQSALAGASKASSGPLPIGGTNVQPGVINANVSSAFSSLPASLLAVLAFLLACAAALSGRSIQKAIRDHRTG